MIDTDRLARVALAAVLQELEGDPASALARLLGVAAPVAIAPTPTPAPVVDRDPKPANAPVAHRDMKPHKTPERPAARRRVAESRRPAPAPPVARPKKPARSVAALGRRGVVDPEVARMAAALIEKHGSALAAAPLVPTSATMLRRWARGRACWPETVVRLRKALEVERVDERQGQADEDALAPPIEQTEAARLVGQLAGKHGDMATAAQRCGFGDAALARWAAGGACSPHALGRLREAVGAPLGRADAERRQEASGQAVDAGEEPALPQADEAA